MVVILLSFKFQEFGGVWNSQWNSRWTLWCNSWNLPSKVHKYDKTSWNSYRSFHLKNVLNLLSGGGTPGCCRSHRASTILGGKSSHAEWAFGKLSTYPKKMQGIGMEKVNWSQLVFSLFFSPLFWWASLLPWIFSWFAWHQPIIGMKAGMATHHGFFHAFFRHRQKLGER